MAVIIMVGLPASGKSSFVDEFEKYAPCHVIRPEVTGEIKEWYGTLNKATALIYSGDSKKHIVIDTCGASPSNFGEVFAMAELRSCEVVVIYVHALPSECVLRAGADFAPVITKYIPKIKDAVKNYNSKYKVIAVTNQGTLVDLANRAKEVASSIEL